MGDEANAVALLPDGRIVAAGTSNQERAIVVRYLEDGTLDTSFSGDGIAGTPRSAHLWGAEDLAIQPNGRIVVVGAGQEGTKYEFAAARFLANGKRDRTFSDDGMVLTQFDWGQARAVALQPDGKIVVAGFHSRGLALLRYLPDGSLDRTFGDRGRVGFWDDPAPWAIFGLAVAIQSNGRIVAAGNYDIFALGIARLLPDGRLDTSFGGDGVVRTQVVGNEQAFSALALQPGGKILAAGYSGPHESSDDVVAEVRRGPLPVGRLARRHLGWEREGGHLLPRRGARCRRGAAARRQAWWWPDRSASTATKGSRWLATWRDRGHSDGVRVLLACSPCSGIWNRVPPVGAPRVLDDPIRLLIADDDEQTTLVLSAVQMRRNSP